MRDVRREAGGTVLRIVTDFIDVDVRMPHVVNHYATKHGTGFLMQLNGAPILCTAHHVVSNAVTVRATASALGDAEPRTLTIVGYNPHMDVCFLMGPPELMNLPRFLPATSSSLSPTDRVVCVGFAAATLRVHTTSGSVTGRSSFPHNRLQIDCAVNPGNSGGPVLNDKGQCIGVVTSGMDDMQTTNFATGTDELYYCYRRVTTQGVDLGLTLDAVLRPVDRSACRGELGGALVAAALPATNLAPGDVIVELMNSDHTRMLPVDAQMRVRDDKVWQHDSLDLRSLFDTYSSTDARVVWPMTVRRDAKRLRVDVPLGPSNVGIRGLHPDCEDLRYVVLGGLVLQRLSRSHQRHRSSSDSYYPDVVEPRKLLASMPVVTHVVAGSPFAAADMTELEGNVPIRIGNVAVETLDDVRRAVDVVCAASDYCTVEFVDGSRVGASRDALDAYAAQVRDPTIANGGHATRLREHAAPNTYANACATAKEDPCWVVA